MDSIFLARSLSSVGGGAWAGVTRIETGDIIDLTVADPDLSTPEAVVERAVAALRAGDTHYAETAGRPELRRAVADYCCRLAGRPTEPEEVLVTAGAQCALYLAVRCLAGPGDALLTVEPAYVNYPATLASTGAQVGFIQTDPDKDFRLTEDVLSRAIQPGVKAIVLSNPNNPTGRRLGIDELHALVSIAYRHDLWLVCDEIYGDLTHDGGFVSLASTGYERLVLLGGLSKSHAMTGWRVGWMIAPKPLVALATQLADVIYHGLPGFVQEAAGIALADRVAPRLAVGAYLGRLDAFVRQFDNCTAIEPRLPEAGLFILCDIRRTGVTGAEFAQLARKEAAVAVVDGGRFGRASAGFVRIAFTKPERVLREAAQRLARLGERLRSTAATLDSSALVIPSPLSDEVPEYANGVYISPSGIVHVWRNGNLDAMI